MANVPLSDADALVDDHGFVDAQYFNHLFARFNVLNVNFTVLNT